MTGSGGQTIAQGTLQISGINTKIINQRTLTNAGSATWTGTGAIGGGLGAVISNTGTFNVQNDANMQGSGSGGTFTFNNSGVFTKLASTGLTDMNSPVFTNTGTVDVQTGTLELSTLTNYSGTTLTGGTYLLAGTFKFNGANIVTNAATIVLDGPASALLNNTTETDGLKNFAVNAAAAGPAPAGSFTVKNGQNIATPAF